MPASAGIVGISSRWTEESSINWKSYQPSIDRVAVLWSIYQQPLDSTNTSSHPADAATCALRRRVSSDHLYESACGEVSGVVCQQCCERRGSLDTQIG